MKPGDIIEWTYVDAIKLAVFPGEQLWSFSNDGWIAIGPELTHVLISIDDEQMFWMNAMGTFHMMLNHPMITPAPTEPRTCVVPRKKM